MVNTCDNPDESQKYFVQGKKPDIKAYVLCDSIYVKFWKMQGYRKKSVQWLS